VGLLGLEFGDDAQSTRRRLRLGSDPVNVSGSVSRAMDIRLLGPVDVTVGPAPIEVRGRKERALLARLALDAGQVVPVDALIDALWGDDVPGTAAKMIQIQVSHLRKALPEGVVQTVAPGYVLEVPKGDVDVFRFDELRRLGASALGSDMETASRILGQALAVWRGPPFAGLSEPFALSERALLEGRRLECVEDRAEAELALGRHSELVGQLTSIVSQHPLRERPHRQLMLALYRAGRHAEALDVYRSFRRRLGDELGIDPPAALRRLEEQMLRQEPELDVAPAPTPVRAPSRPPARNAAPPAAAVRAPVRFEGRPSDIRYAASGEASIAYQVFGGGDVTIAFVPGFVSHLEVLWEDPATARFFRRLASFARVVVHDKREQGLSDRFGRPPTVEEGVADIEAVLDAAGVERAALLGISEGGPLAIAFAATRPQRTSALVAYGTWARLVRDDDYPSGLPAEVMDRWQREVLRDWGSAFTLSIFAPSMMDDAHFTRWWARLLRTGTSPRGAASLFEWHLAVDIRPILGEVRAPTLVLHRRDDRTCGVDGGRYVAEHIPGARFVPLSGSDHLWMCGDQDELLDEVEEFLTGGHAEREPDRALLTLLFVDIVRSTERARALGDRRWRDLLVAYEDRATGLLERHRGRLVKLVGDGMLASFDQPAMAIRCARAVRRDVAELGLEVRAGVHTGEVELRGGDLAGLAVHIGARVASTASPGELLVSSTVKDLVAGSGLRFFDRGRHELRGVPDRWSLYAVAD
jgi:DNA-binding SARP family transcriptional activator/class 3 adenylate cyclase